MKERPTAAHFAFVSGFSCQKNGPEKNYLKILKAIILAWEKFLKKFKSKF